MNKEKSPINEPKNKSACFFNNTEESILNKTINSTVWNKDKKITGLWSVDQNRNVMTHIYGKGWKKLDDNSESGMKALNMLALHAMSKQLYVDYRDEKDGKIHEIYVW